MHVIVADNWQIRITMVKIHCLINKAQEAATESRLAVIYGN